MSVCRRGRSAQALLCAAATVSMLVLLCLLAASPAARPPAVSMASMAQTPTVDEAELVREVIREYRQQHPRRVPGGTRPEWADRATRSGSRSADLLSAGSRPLGGTLRARRSAAGVDLLHDAWLAWLRRPAVRATLLPEIGVTLAFKIHLQHEDTARWGLFKTQICHSPAECNQFLGDTSANEVLGYHLDRLLGFYRTPPVIGRRLPASLFAPLLAEAQAMGQWGRYVKGERLEYIWAHSLLPDEDGLVLGTLAAGLDLLVDGGNLATRPQAPQTAREYAERMVFDYLVQNRDRSSNNNAHNKPTLRRSTDLKAASEYALFPGFVPGMSVVFIDNGRGFTQERSEQPKHLDECRFSGL